MMSEKFRTGTTLTTTQWIEVLNNPEITTPKDISVLQIMYAFEGHKAAASKIQRDLDSKKSYQALILQIGRWGRKLVKVYPVRLTKRNGSERKWDIFFDGRKEGKLFTWKIKKELVEALEKTENTGEMYYPEEIRITDQNSLTEGLKRTVAVNKYERNAKARHRCIAHWKAVCAVCNFDFEEKYGSLGKGYIHVHHLVPLSDIGRTYKIDPITDLIPVCPNCHSMLHKKNPPLKIDELKEIIQKVK